MSTGTSALRRFHSNVSRWLLPLVRPLTGSLLVGAAYDFGPGVGVLRAESPLGEGTYAHAFMMRNVDNIGVAVKVVDFQKQPRADVEREVALQKRCAGSYVIDVVHAVYTDTHAYLLMEPADRVSLEERLERLLSFGRTVDIQEALTWFHSMVEAVGACHARGVVHGDIKPDNFVITRNGSQERANLKLTDFGFARMLGEPASDAIVSGTITHAAPEVLRDEAPRFAADMWSLGTSLYRLIMGIEPYYDETPERIAERVRNNAPQFTVGDMDAKLKEQGVQDDTRAHVCMLVTMLLQPTPADRWDIERVRASAAFQSFPDIPR